MNALATLGRDEVRRRLRNPGPRRPEWTGAELPADMILAVRAEFSWPQPGRDLDVTDGLNGLRIINSARPGPWGGPVPYGFPIRIYDPVDGSGIVHAMTRAGRFCASYYQSPSQRPRADAFVAGELADSGSYRLDEADALEIAVTDGVVLVTSAPARVRVTLEWFLRGAPFSGPPLQRRVLTPDIPFWVPWNDPEPPAAG